MAGCVVVILQVAALAPVGDLQLAPVGSMAQLSVGPDGSLAQLEDGQVQLEVAEANLQTSAWVDSTTPALAGWPSVASLAADALPLDATVTRALDSLATGKATVDIREMFGIVPHDSVSLAESNRSKSPGTAEIIGIVALNSIARPGMTDYLYRCVWHNDCCQMVHHAENDHDISCKKPCTSQSDDMQRMKEHDDGESLLKKATHVAIIANLWLPALLVMCCTCPCVQCAVFCGGFRQPASRWMIFVKVFGGVCAFNFIMQIAFLMPSITSRSNCSAIPIGFDFFGFIAGVCLVGMSVKATKDDEDSIYAAAMMEQEPCPNNCGFWSHSLASHGYCCIGCKNGGDHGPVCERAPVE